VVTAAKSLRVGGIFLVNLLIAVVGTAIIDTAGGDLRHARLTIRTLALTEDLLSAAAVFGLGYFVYRRWKPASSRWVWLAGLGWFAWGALLTLDGKHGTVLLEASPNVSVLDFNINDLYSRGSLENWTGYMLPLLRTIFYSTGAFCCSRFGPTLEAAILSHFPGYTGKASN
jgi:hypothetical protein